MGASRIQIAFASLAIVLAAIFAQLLQPHQLMARTAAAPQLDSVIPRQFGTWTLIPEISPIKPADPEGYVQPDLLSAKIYSQEVGRAYTDGHGNTVMFLVAYGPAQNYRLKSHRPEICYTANGFRVSEKTKALLRYKDGAPPIEAMRLITQRESRFEPVTYWMKIGNEISNSVIDNQISRLKYGLQGIIPDGALIRVSTVGLSREASFKLQDRFIRDLLAAIPPTELKFFTGSSS